MKTADKLAQLARANQKKTSSNTCRVCGGIGQESTGLINVHNISKSYHRGEVEFETKNVSCLKCVNCGHSWVPPKNEDDLIKKKLTWGSHQYVRFVKEKCKELALKGFGSVSIKIDRTTDLFQTDEGRNSFYDSQFVITLLVREGFKFLSETDETQYIDHYDAFSDVLVWDKTLPKANDSDRIGMSWK